jgi:hypothetical protein
MPSWVGTSQAMESSGVGVGVGLRRNLWYFPWAFRD